MIRADIFLINPVSVIGYATFRVRTFAGAMRHSLVANADLGHAMGIKTGILARPIDSGLRVEAANVNAMGTVVFGSRRCYKVLDVGLRYQFIHYTSGSNTCLCRAQDEW